MNEAFEHVFEPRRFEPTPFERRIDHAPEAFLDAATLDVQAEKMAAMDIALPVTSVIIDARCPQVSMRDRFLSRRWRSGMLEDSNYTFAAVNRQADIDCVEKILVLHDEDFSVKSGNPERSIYLPLPPSLSVAQGLNRGLAFLGRRSEMTVTTRAGYGYATDQALRAAAFCLGQGFVGVSGAEQRRGVTTLAKEFLSGAPNDLIARSRQQAPASVMHPNRAAFRTDMLMQHFFPVDNKAGNPEANPASQWAADMRLLGRLVAFESLMTVHRRAHSSSSRRSSSGPKPPTHDGWWESSSDLT